MKLMWRTAGYNKWDHKRNEDILDKLSYQLQILFRIIRGNGAHEQNDSRKAPPTKSMLSAKGTNINLMSSDETGGNMRQ
jgi:hypothetical protein